MIKDLLFTSGEGKILEGYVGETAFCLYFRELHPFWSYATEEDFEGGFAKIIGNKILFCLTTACGQGGIVVLWNAETKEIEHISEASYCVAAGLSSETIYTLHYVSNYVVEGHFELWKIPVGIIDADREGKKIVANLSQLDVQYNGDCSALKLVVSKGQIRISLNDRCFTYDALQS